MTAPSSTKGALPAAAATYRERLSAREARLAALRRRDGTIANLRLVVAGVGLVLLWPALVSRVIPAGWLLLPVGAFVALAAAHGGVIRRRDLAERAVRFYRDGIARLEERWHGRGRSGAAFLDPEHPYAADLDLFGEGSLFELVSAARTSAGEATLAGWLLRPAAADEVADRQAAVSELRGRLELREELSLAGEDVSFDLDPDELVEWAEAPAALGSRWLRPLAWTAAAVNVACVAGWWMLPYGSLPLLPAIVLGGGCGLILRRRVGSVLAAASRPKRQLALWAELLGVLEQAPLESPRLALLRSRLSASGVRASARVAALARLVEWNDSRRNVLFAPLAGLLFVGTHLALAVERWRRDCGRDVAGWLAALGELEALSSLAGIAWERPEDPFPELVEEACFEAHGLGHPLLPAADCVRNDLRLDGRRRLLLVSGSNMSGKSTLLRSVGVNAVLALAGGTVRADRLRLGVLAVGASLRAEDSLRAGTSRFYAEIRRLQKIREIAAGDRTLLFLLDEILHGTNSHDRRIGAEGVIRGFLDDGGLGLVTTHDLALAEIAEGLAPRARNVHFEDRLEDGRMVFDYRLREGVVEKSNALELMRDLGLDV